jgi:hypothetical protein
MDKYLLWMIKVHQQLLRDFAKLEPIGRVIINVMEKGM